MERRALALARLFDSVAQGAYVGVLDADGTTRTLAANAHLKLILGYPADTADTDVRPFDRAHFFEAQAHQGLLDRIRTDGTVINHRLRLRRADSSPVWVEVTGRTEQHDASEQLLIEALIRDVTERKQLDDETRDIYQQLLQSEKMAALGQTISGVAHELNNPLASILSWAERLEQSGQSNPTVKRGLDVILKEAERAARIVRQLLTFARKRQTTRALVDVNQVVRETLNLRAYEQRVSNITVVEALASGLPPVFVDGYQIQQVVLNLVINAEQAMLSSHGQGVLVVRTWHDSPHNQVIVEINDDGPGVPDELKPKIFDPFFTTKGLGQGTGLGLTVVYTIVHEHGGRIRLDSKPAGGASFYIELPLPPAPVSKPALARQPVSAAGTRDASILVVEDEPSLAAAVLDVLADAGYHVEHANDGAQALDMAFRRGYDLIICDLKMPRVGGQEVFRRLTEQMTERPPRMVFMTGDVAGTDAQEFLERSGCLWLAKPFRLAELLRVVKESLV